MNTKARYRSFAWTLNNYTNEDICYLNEYSYLFNYLVYGKEVGKNGTPHLQGYCYFKNAKSFTAAKAALPGQPHIEVCHHSPQQNADYCKKGDDFKEWGTIPLITGFVRGFMSRRAYS